MRSVLALAIWLAASPAVAQELLRQPTAHCSDILTAMDSDDQRAKGYAVQYLADVYNDADLPFVARKMGSTVQGLSDDGFKNIIALGLVQCRKTPDALAKDVMVAIYVAFRGMQKGLGTVK